jgi:flagellar basal-body rod modification protein FlgD
VTIPPVTAASATATQTQAQQAANATDPIANEDVFLQLLVAQLQYQDPDSPADGTQFVTQLAQFSTLEQDTESRADLDSINTVAQSFTVPAAPTSGTVPATNTGTVTGTSTGTTNS